MKHNMLKPGSVGQIYSAPQSLGEQLGGCMMLLRWIPQMMKGGVRFSV